LLLVDVVGREDWGFARKPKVNRIPLLGKDHVFFGGTAGGVSRGRKKTGFQWKELQLPVYWKPLPPSTGIKHIKLRGGWKWGERKNHKGSLIQG